MATDSHLQLVAERGVKSRADLAEWTARATRNGPLVLSGSRQVGVLVGRVEGGDGDVVSEGQNFISP